MSHSLPPDLQQFVELRVASGQYASEEELLRAAFRALSEAEDDLVAVQEAVERFQNGERGAPLAEAMERIRQQVELPPSA